jgi:phage terminase Nu1 subunit (DNA packaging protein)
MVKPPPKREITKAAFAVETGMSPPRVSRFLKTGVIPTTAAGKVPMPDALHALIEHLSEVAAGRGGRHGVGDLTAERARLAKEQADGHALKNAIARGEYLAADTVRDDWDSAAGGVRSAMLAIPSTLPLMLPHLTRFDLEVIDRAIRDALTALADRLDAGEYQTKRRRLPKGDAANAQEA